MQSDATRRGPGSTSSWAVPARDWIPSRNPNLTAPARSVAATAPQLSPERSRPLRFAQLWLPGTPSLPSLRSPGVIGPSQGLFFFFFANCRFSSPRPLLHQPGQLSRGGPGGRVSEKSDSESRGCPPTDIPQSLQGCPGSGNSRHLLGTDSGCMLGSLELSETSRDS